MLFLPDSAEAEQISDEQPDDVEAALTRRSARDEIDEIFARLETNLAKLGDHLSLAESRETVRELASLAEIADVSETGDIDVEMQSLESERKELEDKRQELSKAEAVLNDERAAVDLVVRSLEQAVSKVKAIVEVNLDETTSSKS